MVQLKPARPCKSITDKSCGVNATCVGNWTTPREDLASFDNIGYSMLAVFQIVTLENWHGFCHNVGYQYLRFLDFKPNPSKLDDRKVRVADK